MASLRVTFASHVCGVRRRVGTFAAAQPAWWGWPASFTLLVRPTDRRHSYAAHACTGRLRLRLTCDCDAPAERDRWFRARPGGGDGPGEGAGPGCYQHRRISAPVAVATRQTFPHVSVRALDRSALLQERLSRSDAARVSAGRACSSEIGGPGDARGPATTLAFAHRRIGSGRYPPDLRARHTACTRALSLAAASRNLLQDKDTMMLMSPMELDLTWVCEGSWLSCSRSHGWAHWLLAKSDSSSH